MSSDKIGITMDEVQIFTQMKEVILDVLPTIETKSITPTNSLRDLGANSVDRAEILIRTMAELKLKIPLIEFGKAKNINELIAILMKANQN